MQEQTTYLTVDQGRDLALAVLKLARGTLEAEAANRTRWIEEARELAFWIAYEKPSPAPAPSCDTPHCDRDTGEDCKANGAAEPAQDSYDRLNRWQQASAADTARTARSLAAKLRARHVPPCTLAWKGDRFAVTDGIATATTDVIAPNATVQDSVVAINALVRGMRLNMIAMESVVALQDDGNGKVTPIYGSPAFEAPPAPDLTAKLDGLKDAVDALAERLERGPATGMMSDPLKVSESAPTLDLLPLEFLTPGVTGAAFRLQRALGIHDSKTSSAAVEAFRQGHLKAWRRQNASRAQYEETDDQVIRRAAEDLIGYLGMTAEGVDWASVDRFKEIAEG